ncbi:phosphonate C-P lyase system protein PhnG [Clostridium lacusfryxellense]|uniref:phosphonate C-P lyase system protein PhnG n=1 Tax=Clostridium lacusfryxellense TaxID=205328 RepID=UPI001C0AFC25|nr:phosphonate C-P lyase system protein PhnG [Clostridium lacusfryxellense]MBU3112535.1 phosphonate C-P lyase system protein PhnG [Clostridium lacusfryxellense]
MNRKRRTEILIKGSTEIAKKISSEIEENYIVKIVEEPNYGLVMVKIREGAKKTLFYIGEVFVTEAKVLIEGKLGIGIISGNNTELAYCLGVIDAAYNASLKETKAWEEILICEEINIKREIKKREAKTLLTKVNFENMGE